MALFYPYKLELYLNENLGQEEVMALCRKYPYFYHVRQYNFDCYSMRDAVDVVKSLEPYVYQYRIYQGLEIINVNDGR